MRLLATSVLAIMLTGCMNVPATRIGFDPKTGALTIKSPKEIEMTNVTVSVIFRTDGSKEVKANIGGYASKNSPDVLAAVAGANVRLSDNLLKMGEMFSKSLGKGAVEGLIPGAQLSSGSSPLAGTN